MVSGSQSNAVDINIITVTPVNMLVPLPMHIHFRHLKTKITADMKTKITADLELREPNISNHPCL